MSGTLFIVATPIGNLEDITARALRVLRSVSVIAAEDTRRTAGLLAHFGIATSTLSLHAHNEQARIPRLIDRLLAGEDVAVVSDAGTPTISDPGRQLVLAAVEAGVRVEPIPGASAVLTALSASGFDTSQFTFLGFPPTRSKDRKEWLGRLAAVTGVAVFYEAPHRIADTLREVAHQIGHDVPALIGRELTKAHEQLVRGPISALLTRLESAKGEFTVVIDLGKQQNVWKASAAPAHADLDWTTEIGVITKNTGVSRRRAINILARRTGMAPNEVYAAVEKAKKLVKQQS